MKENKTLIRIICAIALIITCNLFLGCGLPEIDIPEECATPTEFGLIDFNTNDVISFTYGWTDMPDAQEYIFTLRVNNELEYIDTLVNNQVQFIVNSFLQDGDELTATVEAVCGDGTLSEPNKDTFIYRGIAAVETVYYKTQACSTPCDYVKFSDSGQFCGYFMSCYLKVYYYPKDDFCDCLPDGSGYYDCPTDDFRAFTTCLKTMKNKIVAEEDSPDC